jgi:hypothetical protein
MYRVQLDTDNLFIFVINKRDTRYFLNNNNNNNFLSKALQQSAVKAEDLSGGFR